MTVTYAQAERLHEAGAKCWSYMRYTGEGTLVHTSSAPWGSVAAPTASELIEWLRKEHRIYAYVFPVKRDGRLSWHASMIYLRDGRQVTILKNPGGHDGTLRALIDTIVDHVTETNNAFIGVPRDF